MQSCGVAYVDCMSHDKIVVKMTNPVCSSSELLYLSSQVLQEYYTRKVWEKNIVVTLHTGILYISTSELQFKKRDVLNQYVGVAPGNDTPPAATFVGNRSTACIIVLHVYLFLV